jgi:hypothetical protein
MFYSFRNLLIAASLSLGLPGLVQAQEMELPDGQGKELVQASCVACHETNMITGSTGYTHDQGLPVIWQRTSRQKPIDFRRWFQGTRRSHSWSGPCPLSGNAPVTQ